MLQPCRNGSFGFLGPSTSEEGNDLDDRSNTPVGCVAPKIVSICSEGHIVQLFSLVAHANLALAKVVGGEDCQAS